MATAKSKPELLVIVGATASGKSALAMKIAGNFDGEIISADSWQVYKGFDIGTSKPNQTEQKRVKHHLIDIREAQQGFNAPLFKELAEKAIADIQNRGKLPILTGGTGLYIDSLLYDFGFLPDVPAEQREILNKLSISELLEKARAEGIDLAGIDTRNKRRIIRAIEAGGARPTRSEMKKNTLIVGLRIDNDQLRRRVEQRVDKMLSAGLEKEVKNLADKYGWDIEPMKGIGYREWQAYFKGERSLEETKQRVVSSTMNLAKRQRTWFKRNPDIHWFDSAESAYSFVAGILNT
ncbi:MAG TPA: tRNA (adenosine(37)-N6)-dimethylallyltransferase MiaA [Candidatus Saccharimonadales bacterium]|nr:tRNA (adenosine(37)-N6)-dimethylallyltransferase MiaA [Candidatus Saccharimonadales bacterium]